MYKLLLEAPVTPNQYMSSRRGIDNGEEDLVQPVAPHRRHSINDESSHSRDTSKGSTPDTEYLHQPQAEFSQTFACESTTIMKRGRRGGLSIESAGGENGSFFIFTDEDDDDESLVEEVQLSDQVLQSKDPKIDIEESSVAEIALEHNKQGKPSAISGRNSIGTATFATANSRQTPELRSQTVPYVNDFEMPLREQPSRPVSQQVSGITQLATTNAMVSSELAKSLSCDSVNAKSETRTRILQESVHAEVLGREKPWQAFIKKYWLVLAVVAILSAAVSIAVALLIVVDWNSNDDT